MAVKVRIKAGPVEFEYEGETELGVADIKDLFSHIETLFKVPTLAESSESHASPQTPVAEQPKPSANGPIQKLHINSVATKLKAKTGTEVALAAAAALRFSTRNRRLLAPSCSK